MKKLLYRMFSNRPPLKSDIAATKSGGSAHSYPETPAKPMNVNSIQRSKEMQQLDEKYMIAYESALYFLKKEDFVQARLKANEAFSYLIKLERHTIPAMLGADFGKISSLLEEIDHHSAKNKY